MLRCHVCVSLCLIIFAKISEYRVLCGMYLLKYLYSTRKSLNSPRDLIDNCAVYVGSAEVRHTWRNYDLFSSSDAMVEPYDYWHLASNSEQSPLPFLTAFTFDKFFI
jgi:hypothetical protein